jgi:hypothetical protein
MPEENINLSTYKMSWNSRNKLNFAQYFKQIDTHKELECSVKKKLLKLYQRASWWNGWWMMHLFSCQSPSLELNFCCPSLNFICGYFPRNSTPPVLEVSCILPKVLFYLCYSPSWSILLVRKLVGV